MPNLMDFANDGLAAPSMAAAAATAKVRLKNVFILFPFGFSCQMGGSLRSCDFVPTT
jgi:hypothetical protein